VATQDFEIKKAIKQFYVDTGADLTLLPFSLHDFGGRGVTCAEQAEIGGAAHTVNFMGSDTVEGVLAANFYYKEKMAAFSVYATEHSVQCSYGSSYEHQIEYIRSQLHNAPRNTIISIVLDGYDVYREAETCCTVLKNEIIESKVKVVFRPDSGDMMVVVPKILHMQENAFGYTINSKGFKKINNVGIIQGDGVDHLAIKSLLGHLMSYGYAADNVIFGSGGALLQKCNRDTFKFAQKAGAILINGKWTGIAKTPITDSGKNSKEGVLTLVRNSTSGELYPQRLEQGMPNNVEDMHKLVYYNGSLYNETTLAEIRKRCEV
jgi:nicotinamide phosphoribosyltransferase